MRIALLTELFYPHMAGTERRFLEIGKRLVKKGHDVHVFTVRYDKNMSREEIVEGISVHRYGDTEKYISTKGFRSLDGVLKYSFLTFVRLLKQDFDMYYSNQWPILHSICAKQAASPLIQEWCEVWTKPSQAIVLQKLLGRFCDHHVAVSEFTKQRLVNLLEIEPKKVAAVPNGVDRSKFSRGSSKRVYGRIIYVGRLAPHKHVELLVDAFRIVKEKAPEAELHIVGLGPCLSSIKNKAYGLKDCFIHGFLHDDQVIDLLESSWLFVLPSEREGSGIAVLEGMAAGLPFVTVDCPDNASKELTRFKCGVAVHPDAGSVASAILRFLDEDLWKGMSCNALTFAHKYDWDDVATQMEDVMFKVLDSAEK